MKEEHIQEIINLLAVRGLLYDYGKIYSKLQGYPDNIYYAFRSALTKYYDAILELERNPNLTNEEIVKKYGIKRPTLLSLRSKLTVLGVIPKIREKKEAYCNRIKFDYLLIYHFKAYGYTIRDISKIFGVSEKCLNKIVTDKLISFSYINKIANVGKLLVSLDKFGPLKTNEIKEKKILYDPVKYIIEAKPYLLIVPTKSLGTYVSLKKDREKLAKKILKDLEYKYPTIKDSKLGSTTLAAILTSEIPNRDFLNYLLSYSAIYYMRWK